MPVLEPIRLYYIYLNRAILWWTPTLSFEETIQTLGTRLLHSCKLKLLCCLVFFEVFQALEGLISGQDNFGAPVLLYRKIL
jgi:hypothetical protein